MTISDTTNALLKFFRDNGDVFDSDDHFRDIVPVSVDEALEREILLVSLAEFEKHELLVRLPHKPAVFVLRKPLEQYSAAIELKGATIGALAQLVNTISRENGLKETLVDPLNLTDADVRTLICIAHHLLEQRRPA